MFESAASVDLLLQQDLRRAFAEHAVAAVMVSEHRAHGLPHGVEGVDFEEPLLGDFIADALVISAQVKGESQ